MLALLFLLLAAVQYTAFLNSGGRILHDAFLFRDPGTAAVFLDTPAQGSSDLVAHLKRYRLRAAVSVDDVSPEWRVWAALPPVGGASVKSGDAGSSGPNAQWHSDPRLQVRTGDANEQAHLLPTDRACLPCAQALGQRAVMPAAWSPEVTASPATVPYDVHRVRLGVGETAAELGGEVALECNLDGLHGVSFTKGCYIGQELTSRTHFRGVIRKRVMPFTLPSAPVGASRPHVARGDAVCDAATGTPLGRVLAFHPGASCGLALLRLGEPQQRHRVACAGEQAEVEVHTPAWWPQSWLAAAAAAGQT